MISQIFIAVASILAAFNIEAAIDKDGKAFSWGFSANYQTGQGTDDDISAPTRIENTAVREIKLVWAGAGGQYSIVASHKDSE